MNELKIQLDSGTTAFQPGETISGTATWSLPEAPASAELSLFWHTRGKGTEDMDVVHKLSFPNPMAQESRPFTLSLPQAPYSFSGKLISLIWVIELSADFFKEVARVEIVLSPSKKEILIGS
jgi:hypothetical protein